MRRFVTAATSLCLLLVWAPLPAHAAGNSPPVAVDDPGATCGSPPFDVAYPVTEDWHDWAPLALGCAPLINDTDPDGDPLSVELVGQPAHGEAMVIENDPTDWLAYRPAKDYSTPRGDEPDGTWISDTITYRASDGQASSNEASYRIWVAPVNDPPTFTPGPALIETHAGDGPVAIQWATDVSPGPANESGQQVSFEIMAPSAEKFADPPAIDSDGVLTFTPGDEPWLATVVVNAKDDGGVEDWNLPASAPYDKPDDSSETVTFEIAIFPDDGPPLDTDPPVVDELAATVAPGAIGTTTVPIRLSWRGTDDDSGVTGYELQQQVTGGAWTAVTLPSPTSTTIVQSPAAGTTARFRIRATDGAANQGPFVEWDPIRVDRRQERSGAIDWTGSWARADDDRLSGGHSRHTKATGRRATFSFTGDSIAWVSRRAPNAGRARVRIDGVRVATVDLHAAIRGYRRIAFTTALATDGPHTIEIRPLGDGRVDVDAFIVLD